MGSLEATPNPCVERTGKRRRFACHLPAAHAQRYAAFDAPGTPCGMTAIGQISVTRDRPNRFPRAVSRAPGAVAWDASGVWNAIRMVRVSARSAEWRMCSHG
jgi:hypothetical protein